MHMMRATVRDGLATSLFGWYLWLMTIWLANAVCQLGEVDLQPVVFHGDVNIPGLCTWVRMTAPEKGETGIG